MRGRSVVVGAAVATGLLAVGQVAASANVIWCMSDPPAQVSTTAGQNLSVNTSVYLLHGQQRLASLVTESTSTAPDGHGGTLITVTVGVPRGATEAKVVSTVNRFGVSAEADGVGGSTLTLYLDVPAA